MMTVQRISTIIGSIAIAAVVAIAAIATWSALRPGDSGPAPVAEGPALGDLTGYVGRVDGTARTLDVAETPTGLHPTMLVVTSDTAIVVHGKPGSLGDLTKDMPVRVFYEVRNDVKYVTSLQVIADSAQASRSPAADPLTADSKQATAPTPPPAATAAEPKPVPEAKPPAVAEPKPAAEPRPAVSASATDPKPPAVAKPPGPPGVATEPSPTVTTRPPPPPAPVPPPPPRMVPPPVEAPPSAAASIGAASVSPAPPADADADGSAAVDWLFRSRGR